MEILLVQVVPAQAVVLVWVGLAQFVLQWAAHRTLSSDHLLYLPREADLVSVVGMGSDF